MSNDPVNWQTREVGGSPGSVDLGSVSLEHPGGLPSAFSSVAIYPNPFQQSASLTFATHAGGHVNIRLYDVLGREVAVLHNAPIPAGGEAEVTINRANLSAGAYFVILESDKNRITRPVIIR